MAIRQVQLTPDADPILDSLAESYGGDADRALSELLIAHDSIESFLDEIEGENAAELVRQRDASARDFSEGHTVPWDQIKLEDNL